MSLLRFLLALWLLAAAPWLHAQDVQPVPALQGRVIDRTGTLSAAQAQALEGKLAALEASHGAQVVLLLVPSTAPEDIAAYAQRVADSWKIGRRGVGDGLLVVVAKEDRRMRIEVAKALEGAVPDLAARQIIDTALRPAFRDGDYAGGLNQAVDQIAARIRGEALPAPAGGVAPSSGGGWDWQQIALFFFVAVPVVGGVLKGLFGRRFGSLLTAGAAGGVAWWITTSLALAVGAGVVALLFVGLFGAGSSLRRAGHGGPWIGGGWGGGSGGWSGGGGGGGFSSGGGGDFGGGGASGDW